MKAPFIYPEPNLYKRTYGYFDVGKQLTVSVSEEAAHEVPDILDVLKRILGNAQISFGANNAFTLRKLDEADITNINNQYLTSYSYAGLGKEAFVILVRSDRLEVAAAGESGFFYALNTLKQLITEGKTIHNSILFYHPYKEQRQVCMRLPNQKEYEFFLKVLDEIADLKYNSILFKNCDFSDLPQETIEFVESLCGRSGIQAHFSQDNGVAAPEATFELDASSVASWELRSKFTKYIEAIGDVQVSYPGEINEKAMIQEGFIFRLVMGSYALNHFEFANSTWEKVLPLAMERTFIFMRNVRGVILPSRREAADRYPILRRKLIPMIHFSEPMTISESHELSDSVVIRHSLIIEKDIAISGENIGYYSIHYASGEHEQIDLIMDENISCETVKWNHTFNPVTHSYDTDRRLQRVSYCTSPLLHATAISQVVSLYDFEWINPKLSCAINKITAAVTNPKYCLCVYSVDNVVIITKP